MTVKENDLKRLNHYYSKKELDEYDRNNPIIKYKEIGFFTVPIKERRK
ncbi:MAG: hypothetical protein PF518_18735 [Spirochaetaceae bacterium]|jgi:hypothetical protein|nr:hypothetical protein [Spirochaetaceae bacterium]